MKFCEAMDALKSGSKVTREPWKDGVYFKLEGFDVKSYQPQIMPYGYNEDIMISDGWLIMDGKTESSESVPFCEIIPSLLDGKKARLTEWTDMFIYYDYSAKTIIVSLMDVFPFTPDFSSFVAEDWITI